MSKRIAKAKAAKRAASQQAAANTGANNIPVQKEETAKTVETVVETVMEAKKEAEECVIYLQFQNCEYDILDIKKQILEKCEAEEMDSADLRIYVKPEDGKAYYVCAGGSSSVAL